MVITAICLLGNVRGGIMFPIVLEIGKKLVKSQPCRKSVGYIVIPLVFCNYTLHIVMLSGQTFLYKEVLHPIKMLRIMIRISFCIFDEYIANVRLKVLFLLPQMRKGSLRTKSAVPLCLSFELGVSLRGFQGESASIVKIMRTFWGLSPSLSICHTANL